jgi:S-DNA-T family DNA segregation ATPase FtsK/SpoIIIE
MPSYRRRQSRSFGKVRLKKKTLQSLSGLVFILAAGLILLSLFGVSGAAVLLREQVVKYFGFITPLIPFALAFAGLYLLRVKIPFISANTVAGVFLFLVSLLPLVTIFSPARGGVFGSQLADIFKAFLSTPGAVFTLFILILVSFIVFFNTSLETSMGIISWVVALIFNFFKRFFTRKEGQEGEKEPIFASKGMGNEAHLAQKDREEILTATREPVTNLPGDQVWEYPPLDILTESIGAKAARGDIKQNAATIERTLESFGILARVVEVNMGPAVTQYALEDALGTKLTKITSLSNDISLALAAPTGTVRIEAPIPGKSQVGIEVPNITPEIVPLKSVLTSPAMQKATSKLFFFGRSPTKHKKGNYMMQELI